MEGLAFPSLRYSESSEDEFSLRHPAKPKVIKKRKAILPPPDSLVQRESQPVREIPKESRNNNDHVVPTTDIVPDIDDDFEILDPDTLGVED